MDFRKIEAGKMEIISNPGNFNKFLKEMLLPFKAYTDDHQIEFRSLINIPHRPVLYDEDAMQKVLTNLLGNAMKFTPQGGKVTLYATTLHRKGKDLIYLCVQDNGPGIPEEIRSKVFVPNFTTKNTGAGLGLAISKNIVEGSGGKITFQTSEKGTTFFVYLKKK
jgi:signal transduction histidine kinase